MYPNGLERPTVLCSTPFIAQQAISKIQNEPGAVYGAVASTPWICICIVSIRYAYCQQAKLHPFQPTLYANGFANALNYKGFFVQPFNGIVVTAVQGSTQITEYNFML